MLKSKKKIKKNSNNMDMSSMIDVVFLLLIFFIVTAKEVIEEAHIAINFPKQDKKKSSSGKDFSIKIGVLVEISKPQNIKGTLVYDKNAQIYKLGDNNYSILEIKKKINELAELDKDKIVNITTNLNAHNYRLIKLIDICSEVGLKKLNILTAKN